MSLTADLNKKLAGKAVCFENAELTIHSFVDDGPSIFLRGAGESQSAFEVAVSSEQALALLASADSLLAEARQRERIRSLPEVLRLLEDGIRIGELTFDEINAALPMEIADPEDIDEVFTLLFAHGIAVLSKHREGLQAPGKTRRGAKSRRSVSSPQNQGGTANAGYILVSLSLEQAPATEPKKRQRKAVPFQLGPAQTARGAVTMSPSAALAAAEAQFERIGRLGEEVVLTFMLDRWRRAFEQDPERTTGLFLEIVDTYWKVDGELGVVLPDAQDRSGVVVDDPTFRNLIWPARVALGERMGFDIFGVSDDLEALLCVEVKTTTGELENSFFLSSHELRTAQREGERFVIARVGEIFSGQPTLALLPDPARLIAEQRLSLVPTGYEVFFPG